MSNLEKLSIYLDLVAAKAKQLSEDIKHGKTWPGDVQRGLVEIREATEKASMAACYDR